MTEEQLVVCAAVLVTGLLCAAVAGPLLQWLPEPAEPDGKLAYRDLVTPHFLLGCSLCAAVAAAVSWTTLPAVVQPLWTVLAVGGVLLAGVDAVTTWLPLPLTHIAWASMVVATGVGASLAGSWPMLLRAAAGAAFAGGVYLVIWLGWRVAGRGAFGFGDVRFAPLLGAAAGAASWELLLWGLLAGSLLGAGLGIVRLLAHRRGGFPYAPTMLAGNYLAALLLAATR